MRTELQIFGMNFILKKLFKFKVENKDNDSLQFIYIFIYLKVFVPCIICFSN